MGAILFCTSTLVTPELVREFNQQCWTSIKDKGYPDPVFVDPFIPARRDPQQTPGPSKTPVDYVVEIFEGFSDSELRRLFMEHYKHGFGFLPQEAFTVLDERGAQDKTVVIHLWDEDIDDEALSTWRSWRVGFVDAEETVDGLEGSMEMFEAIFLDSDQFTGDDGIFDFQKAKKSWLSAS